MSPTEDALALAFRSGLPFVGLRDHAHDPDLDRLIPPDAARTARAIPLAADDDHIRLAVADPDTDLSPLDQYLAGRQVNLALAPREEIDTLLGPPPPPGEEPEAANEQPAEPEPVTEAEPDLVAEAKPELIADAQPGSLGEAQSEPLAEPEPIPAEGAAATEATPPEPDPLIAELVPSPAGEHEPGALAEGEPETVVEPAAASGGEGPGLGRVAGQEPVGAEEAAPAEASAPEAEGVGPEAVALSADDELAGEMPSWLEPRRRRWRRVVLTVLLVLVVLGLAAVAVVVLVNA